MLARIFFRRVFTSLVLGAALAVACGGSVTSSTDAGSIPDGGGTNADGRATPDSSTPSDGGTPPQDTVCVTAADCAWGEIPHEILQPSDCICLFGCPYLPLSKTTVERRLKQHQALCDPSRDGKGQPCPVDDCITPPAIDCRAGVCSAPVKDAGAD
jgi:hypothetical protein